MFWIDGVGGGSCTHEKGPEVGDWTREKHPRSCQKWENKLLKDLSLTWILFWDQSWRSSVYLLDSQRKTFFPGFWNSPPPWSLCLECWLQWHPINEDTIGPFIEKFKWGEEPQNIFVLCKKTCSSVSVHPRKS